MARPKEKTPSRPGAAELRAYFERALRSDPRIAQSALIERFIEALSALCESIDERLEGRADADGGWEGMESSMSLQALLARCQAEPERESSLRAWPYVRALSGFNEAAGAAGQSDHTVWSHGACALKLVRSGMILRAHFEACAVAGVEPGPAGAWPLKEEEARGWIKASVERRELEAAAKAGRPLERGNGWA